MSLRKASGKIAQQLLKLPPGKFEELDLTKHPHPPDITRLFRNNKFMVMIYDNVATTKGPAIRAFVRKHDETKIMNHWSEMQAIKNEIFGEETVAVEYYPAASQLVDRKNIYWMFIYPDGVLPIPLNP